SKIWITCRKPSSARRSRAPCSTSRPPRATPGQSSNSPLPSPARPGAPWSTAPRHCVRPRPDRCKPEETRSIMITNRSKRPGFSLMMVTAVVAVAAVLGLAILTSNTLQVQASSSQDRVVQADALAESAVNVGLYYLQNLNDPIKCPMPALTVNGSAYTETNKSVGGSVAGAYDLSVTRIAVNQYRIVGTGKATTDSGTVQRTL